MEANIQQHVDAFRKDFAALRAEVQKMIVGHDDIVEGVLVALFVGGHCLLEGVPGLGKTLLVRTLSQVLELKFSRIQFTPDLMPADIIGTNLVYEAPSGERLFRFQPGPIFGQILLADEINRATPKTQSALLEAMQEHQVTVAKERYPMEEPFLVLATQNPIEQEGTYPLPEAQLDRFFFKLILDYSKLPELREILNRTTDQRVPQPQRVMGAQKIEEYRKLVRQVVAAPHVKDYCARLTLATHPKGEHAVEVTNKYVRYGSSPRGAQSLMLGAKVRALLDGRYNVGFDDVAKLALPCLRHRVLVNFEAEAEGVSSDSIVQEVLLAVPREEKAAAAAKK